MATSSTGYCYSDHHHHVSSSTVNQNHMMINHLQSFEPAPDTYAANMVILGFPSKHLQENTTWNNNNMNKGFFTRPSSSMDHEIYSQHDLAAISDTVSYLHDHHEHDDPSLRSSCVFSCEDNHNIHHEHDQFKIIRNSRYLGPAQELLIEFCNLGTKESDHNFRSKMNDWEDENSAIKKQSLYTLDLLELHKRKTKLLQLLQEVDRRYKHYSSQMKGVVQSFEEVAGNGAGLVYSSMASRAMSRHFRCLKDGILNQIKAIKKAMKKKDSSFAPGLIKGETPRLRLVDQTLRQQMSLIESHPWRPQRGLPEKSVNVLRAWLFEHFLHPTASLLMNLQVSK